VSTVVTERIEKTPGICGGAARIRGHRIPVWSLIEARRLGFSDSRLLDSHPALSSADLEAAWDYARVNRVEIERAIWENQAVMDDADGDARLALILRGWQLGFTDEELRDAFATPLTEAQLAGARLEYQRHGGRIVDRFRVLLPPELNEGLGANGPAVRG